MSRREKPAGWTYRPYHFGGGLIGRLRGLWYTIAARWANVDLVAQLNERDQILADQLLAQDRELAELRHDVGVLTTQIAHLRRQLAEQAAPADDPAADA
jgi:hypothetical protein